MARLAVRAWRFVRRGVLTLLPAKKVYVRRETALKTYKITDQGLEELEDGDG